MTQLDLPQVSLTRYVDLLKRRRWQVIPISLLGLLIGGIVAFFIPRYYVANTSIAYQQPPGHVATNPKDPFGAIIDTAKLTLPLAIQETIEKLGWPEAATKDPHALSENCNAIEERLQIFEYGNSRDREFALIRVAYKDRDGDRAANFCNTLVTTWIAQQLTDLKISVERERSAATEEQKQHGRAYDTFLRERRRVQETYSLQPGVELVVQRDQHMRLVAAAQELASKLEVQRTAAATLTATLVFKRDELSGLPVRIPADPLVMMAEIAKTDEGKVIIALIGIVTQRVEGFREGTPARAIEERRLEALTIKLTKMQPPGYEVDAEGLMLNPAREKLKAEIAELELELQQAKAAIGVLEARVARQGASLARQAEGYALYEKNETLLEAAKANVDIASTKVSAATVTLGKLTNQPTVRQEGKAFVPPAPTDPNLLVVALIGCVIGLFAATALILLFDMLQGSYKTIDDVERSLDVPVLGGVSHLETAAQRRTTVRARRRATVFAAAVLVLVSGVVLIYYYDPTRLPPFVRDMLAMVLGTA